MRSNSTKIEKMKFTPKEQMMGKIGLLKRTEKKREKIVRAQMGNSIRKSVSRQFKSKEGVVWMI